MRHYREIAVLASVQLAVLDDEEGDVAANEITVEPRLVGVDRNPFLEIDAVTDAAALGPAMYSKLCSIAANSRAPTSLNSSAPAQDKQGASYPP